MKAVLWYIFTWMEFSSHHLPPYVPDHVVQLLENSRKGDLAHIFALLDVIKDSKFQLSIENLKTLSAKFVNEDMSWDSITSYFKLTFCLIVFARNNGDMTL